MRQIIYIAYENKKLPVIICDDWEGKDKIDKKYGTILLECKDGNFKQSIMPEDLPGFLDALPELIKIKKEVEQEINSNKSEVFQIRLSKKEKIKFEERASKNGYKNLSSYIRAKMLQND